ncbi:Single-stranded DNA-binding protein [hydrothermal vent metagenome]|uniref:Single-stranded DNA-binding protein n=1 Tax=hydrothermal vent metagenome TaxID=652676 RepID=A0A3B1BLC4_9ZZZZ
MPFSLNKVMLIGTLGRDSETSFTTSNVSVTKFSIATEHSRKDKDGNWQRDTSWHNIVAFGLSDFYKDALKKGAKVYVEGRLDYQRYEKDGQTKYYTSIIADFNGIIPLDRRGETSEASSGGGASFTQDAPESSESSEADDLPF